VGFEMPIENFVFSAGGGFLFGAVAGYAIKKVMKIAAVVVGLFVASLAYLSYKGFIDVKWIAMENATRSTLTNVAGQAVHALNNTASQFAAHPSAIAASGLPVAAMFGFVPGLMVGFKKG
jgi:uncharacterized membrane protein (Fun14 family)